MATLKLSDTDELSYHDILYNYLRVLGFDSEAMKAKHHTDFSSQMFHVPNRKAFEEVTHFLLKQLDSKRAAQVFRDVWPIIEKKQEAQFRRILHQWLTEIQEKSSTFMHGHINPAVFLSPSGDKLVQLLAALACHVVHKKMENLQANPLRPPDWNQKAGLCFNFTENVLSAQITVQMQQTAHISRELASTYGDQKALSDALVMQYQDCCKRQLEARKTLQALVKDPSSRGFCRDNICENENKEILQDLRKAVAQKTEETENLWKPLNEFASVDGNAWNIIRSVLDKDTDKAMLDASELLKKVPEQLIEKYQSQHSGTKLELQFKDGQIELPAFFNLFLFALNEEVKGINDLNLPSIGGQVDQLRDRAAALENTVSLLEKVYDRWNSLVIQQREQIQNRRTSVTGSPTGPVQLLPLTPSGPSSRGSSSTPSTLQGVLGLTPALQGVRPKAGPRLAGHRASVGSRSSPLRTESSQRPVSTTTPKTAQVRTDFRKRSPAAQSAIKDPVRRSSLKLNVKPENKKSSQLSAAAAASPSDLLTFSPAEVQAASAATGVSSSEELLQLLESSFASSVGEFSAPVNSSFATHSRDVSAVDAALINEGEKGLLDMSYASLVDDMLDLSLY